jgi:hypothetical protein
MLLSISFATDKARARPWRKRSSKSCGSGLFLGYEGSQHLLVALHANFGMGSSAGLGGIAAYTQYFLPEWRNDPFALRQLTSVILYGPPPQL